MSRRAAIVEEFDDDTDLPLPSRPLPNTGSRGPILSAIDSDGGSDDDDDDDDDAPELMKPTPGPASPLGQQGFRGNVNEGNAGPNVVTDITPYKKWVFISFVWCMLSACVFYRVYWEVGCG